MFFIVCPQFRIFPSMSYKNHRHKCHTDFVDTHVCSICKVSLSTNGWNLCKIPLNIAIINKIKLKNEYSSKSFSYFCS